MSTDEKKIETRRLNYQRRIQTIIKTFGMQSLTRGQMLTLTQRLATLPGEGINDCDLRAAARLTARGLLD